MNFRVENNSQSVKHSKRDKFLLKFYYHILIRNQPRNSCHRTFWPFPLQNFLQRAFERKIKLLNLRRISRLTGIAAMARGITAIDPTPEMNQTMENKFVKSSCSDGLSNATCRRPRLPVADELISCLFVVIRINFDSDFPLQLFQIIQIIATGRFTDVQS